MTENNLTFAKIVANPTPYGWSQVYSAGKLFAAISLERQIESEEKDFLNVLGKEILNTLEQEFFTLETKDLDSIRQAILETQKKIPEDITLSFVIGSTVNNILYLYILGNGKVDIRRDGSLGTLLKTTDQENSSLKEASGLLEENDILILQTKQFSEVISESTLSEFLDNPEVLEAAENLAPLVHEKENPGAAAILVNYKEAVKNELFEQAVNNEPEKTLENSEENSQTYFEKNPDEDSAPKMPKFSLNVSLPKMPAINRSKKIILAIVVIVVIVFGTSIFLAVKKQGSEKLTLEFNNIYPKAEKKYEEGKSLTDLNQTLARDSFTESKNILDSAKNDFPKDSKQALQIASLLSKIQTELGSASPAKTIEAKEVKSDESLYLQNALKNKALYIAKDDTTTYYLTGTSVLSAENNSSTFKTVIKNDNDWKNPAGLATYNGNIYILDKDQNQILKFVAAVNGFGKANYFSSSTTPDFSKSVALAIDNNVYVLFANGVIAKYFKGNSVDFSFKGLDKSISNPTRMYTNTDFDNIYILDNGNARILVFDKSGNLKNQYRAGIIKNALDFEILEKDKKAYILSGIKIYKVDLK